MTRRQMVRVTGVSIGRGYTGQDHLIPGDIEHRLLARIGNRTYTHLAQAENFADREYRALVDRAVAHAPVRLTTVDIGRPYEVNDEAYVPEVGSFVQMKGRRGTVFKVDDQRALVCWRDGEQEWLEFSDDLEPAL